MISVNRVFAEFQQTYSKSRYAEQRLLARLIKNVDVSLACGKDVGVDYLLFLSG